MRSHLSYKMIFRVSRILQSAPSHKQREQAASFIILWSPKIHRLNRQSWGKRITGDSGYVRRHPLYYSRLFHVSASRFLGTGSGGCTEQRKPPGRGLLLDFCIV